MQLICHFLKYISGNIWEALGFWKCDTLLKSLSIKTWMKYCQIWSYSRDKCCYFLVVQNVLNAWLIFVSYCIYIMTFHFPLQSQQHCSLIHLRISGPDTQLLQRGGGRRWWWRWWRWWRGRALFSRMISEISALWFSVTVPPSHRLTLCQNHRWNETPGISFHMLVIFQTLHLFIPLYIDLYFYRFIYFVHKCIHSCTHTGFVS